MTRTTLNARVVAGVGTGDELAPRSPAEALARLLAVAVTDSLREYAGNEEGLGSTSDEEDGASVEECDLWTLVSPCSDFPHGGTPQ